MSEHNSSSMINVTKLKIYLSCIAILLAITTPYVLARWDPYEIVGVERDATIDQIKKAYRESARKLHPDKSNISVRKFIELNKAFDILKDPIKRQRHDRGEGDRFFGRLLKRLIDYTYKVIYFVSYSKAFQIGITFLACVLITVLLIFRDRKCFSKPSHSKEQSFEESTETLPSKSLITQHDPPISAHYLKILELKAETYNGMIRLLKPGHRTIIVLVDLESKESLISQFRKAVWPYRRNKTLLFGYLDIDKNLQWYKSVLTEILDLEDLIIYKKRCIGTVLSLNGFKRYLRVYHIRHDETNLSCPKHNASSESSFLDFDEDDPESGIVIDTDSQGKSECSTRIICPIENLLDKLPLWLDKMFDGMTKRYFLNSWPEDIK